jgi:sugar phosphate isomerase/epimerase
MKRDCMISRRRLGKLALGSLAMSASPAAKIDSNIEGIRFGLQTYVFTVAGLPQSGLLDLAVKTMVEARLGECDLYAPLIEPAEFWDKIRDSSAPAGERAATRQALDRWRASVSLDFYRTIRKKINDAGIDIYGISGFPGKTEEQLGRAFEIAEVLGAKLVSINNTLPEAKQVAPLVDKAGLLVGLMGHPDMHPGDANAISTPANFEEALALSKNYWMSFDIGDATGGGYDALPFVDAHHDRIALIYLKDRRRDRTSVPWGEGDTPVAEVLRLARERKYGWHCFMDCDYKTTDRPGDVKRSFEFAKKALG